MVEFVDLPSKPRPNEASPALVDFGGWQEPIAGGTVTRLDRLGNRMTMAVTMPRMKPEPDGRIWAARLMRATGIDAQLPFPQIGLSTGNPGNPVVDGAGQGGTACRFRGFTAGYSIREGQFFNIIDLSGRAYLHYATQDVAAGSGGVVTIPLLPMMRFSPVDGAGTNFIGPVIMGRVTGNEKGWKLARYGASNFVFAITERR